jgi:hypothetical protein
LLLQRKVERALQTFISFGRVSRAWIEAYRLVQLLLEPNDMTDQVNKLLDDDTPDMLVPDPQVWPEFGVTSMTGHRFDNRPELGFPPPIRIGKRKYRSRKALEAYKRRLIAEAVAEATATHAEATA